MHVNILMQWFSVEFDNEKQPWQPAKSAILISYKVLVKNRVHTKWKVEQVVRK